MPRPSLSPLIALLVAASPAPAQDVSVPVGTLICTLAKTGEDTATPPSQVRDVACLFRSEDGGVEESYVGRVRTVSARGQDLTGVQVLSWTVRAPKSELATPGALEQVYSGDTKAAAASDQVISSLTGDANASITLHATRPGTGTGTVTIVELKLKSAAT
jgi:hypothetical protein